MLPACEPGIMRTLGIILGAILLIGSQYFRVRHVFGNRYSINYKNKTEEYISVAALIIGLFLLAYSVSCVDYK